MNIGRKFTIAALTALFVWGSTHPADAICGRKSCVVGSMPTPSGGGGGGGSYDPFGGMGGMVNMMFGVLGAIEQQQQQMNVEQGRQLFQRGKDLFASGDYVAAIAAYQHALRLIPGDANILVAMQQAQQALDQLRQQEAVRQAADRAALQQRIAGIIGGLSGGFDGERRGAPSAPSSPSALDGVDFAPSGTSFFGTGGGAGGAAPKPAAAKAAPRPATGAPAYGAANPPPQQTQGLDFVGAKDSLFEKGQQGSSTPDLRDSLAGGKPNNPKPSALPEKLDFSTSTAAAQPVQVAASTQAAANKPWSVWAPIGALAVAGSLALNMVDVALPVLVPHEPARLGTQVPKEARQPFAFPSVDPLPPEIAAKRPITVDASLDHATRAAYELSNDAFDAVGAGRVEGSVKFLEAAHGLAPSNTRIARALDAANEMRGKLPSDKELWERINFERQSGVQPRVLTVGRHGVDGFDAAHRGDYKTARKNFDAAATLDPQWKEWTLREYQARIGEILSGQGD